MFGTRKKITKKIEKGKYWNARKKKRTLPSLKPHDQPSYFFYRKHRKTEHEIGEDRTLYSKSVTAIYQAIGELILEREGGVFLEEYGYFNAMVLPWLDSGWDTKGSTDPLFHTDGYNYTLQFFPDTSRKSILRGMIMDRTFTNPIRKGISKRLFDGHRPKLHFNFLKSLYGYKQRNLS